jgi:hypothetical protein
MPSLALSRHQNGTMGSVNILPTNETRLVCVLARYLHCSWLYFGANFLLAQTKIWDCDFASAEGIARSPEIF